MLMPQVCKTATAFTNTKNVALRLTDWLPSVKTKARASKNAVIMPVRYARMTADENSTH